MKTKAILLILCFFINQTDSFARGRGIPVGYYPGFAYLTAHYGALKGMVVYGKDTIPGVVRFTFEVDPTLSPKAVTGENRRMMANMVNGTKQYKFRIVDTELTFISLTDTTGRKLSLIKLTGYNTFWRIIHIGKLSVYDQLYKFSFRFALIFFWENNMVALSTKENPFDCMRFRIKENGKMQKRDFYNSKKYFINTVNRTYNLNLNPHNYKGKELYNLISSLD